MPNTWIVSANASRARFFSQANASAPLQEMEDMVNDAIRQRMMENAISDKMAPTSGSKSTKSTGGQVPSSQYQPAQTPDQRAAEMFARDIAAHLEKGHREGRFDQLMIVASPKFLGALRNLLGAELASKVKLELDKDYTAFAGGELLDQLNARRH